MKKTNIKKLTVMALLIAIAVMLNYFERFIPIAITIPGVRLGIANVVTLVALVHFKFKDVAVIVTMRTLLGTFFYGSISAFMFSLGGGMFALVAMTLLWKLQERGFSMIGISVIGAIFHNIGQVTVAYFILNTSAIFGYLPILLFSSVITGILIGVVGERTTHYLKKHVRL